MRILAISGSLTNGWPLGQGPACATDIPAASATTTAGGATPHRSAIARAIVFPPSRAADRVRSELRGWGRSLYMTSSLKWLEYDCLDRAGR